jgi:hypothetical protein
MIRMRTAAALVAMLLGAAAAAPATAADAARHQGECGYETVSQEVVTGPDRYVGAVWAAVVLYPATPGEVVSATVTCEVRVNGVPRWTSRPASGTGVVALVEPVELTLTDTDVVQLCTTVDYTSDATPTETTCPGAGWGDLPPEGHPDFVDALVETVNGVWPHVDPVACAAFGALAPGAGPVQVTPEGDVYLTGDLLWDCPA